MKTKAEIIIKGEVQKAGYRDFIHEQAFNLELVGNARNLNDRTVKVVCEGDKKKIEKFIESINIIEYPVRVKGIESRYSQPTGEFETFEIIREEKESSELVNERLDMAARYLRTMNTNLGGKIDTMGETLGGKIDGLGGKIDTMGETIGGKIDTMGETLGGKIDGLGGKIDTMGETLGGKIDGLGGKIDTMGETLGGKIDNLTDATQNNFDRMDVKYDIISQNMNKIFVELVKERKESRESMEKLVNAVLKMGTFSKP